MHGITLLLVAAIGVDVGWKPVENGELEYIIQIAPEQLRSLEAGDVIEVGVRPMLRPVRRYRIVVGTDPLPRQTARPEITAETTAAAPQPPTTEALLSISGDATEATTPATAAVKTKTLDHSIVVNPKNPTQSTDNSRWVAASEDDHSTQLQTIPTQPIEALAKPPAIPADQLDILPPPPATPQPPLVPSAQNLATRPAAVDPFVPNYRNQIVNPNLPENKKDYRIGDSVPIDQGTVQASGVVPPTPRLMLPPPPDAADEPVTDSAQSPPLQLPPPPGQTSQLPQKEPPAHKTEIEDSPESSDQARILKTAAAPAVPIKNTKGNFTTPLSSDEQPSAVQQPEKSENQTSGGTWLVLALFASIGGNLFLGYVTWDIRKRFLAAFGQSSSDTRQERQEQEIVQPETAS